VFAELRRVASRVDAAVEYEVDPSRWMHIGADWHGCREGRGRVSHRMRDAIRLATAVNAMGLGGVQYLATRDKRLLQATHAKRAPAVAPGSRPAGVDPGGVG
jgi:hypothetical protein